MGDFGDGAGEALLADYAAYGVAVDDYGSRAGEDGAEHRDVVVWAAFQRADVAQGVSESIGAGVDFYFLEVGVPVVAAYGEVGQEVMEVGFVEHDYAGVGEGGFVGEGVVGVVAELVEDGVVGGGVEGGREGGEGVDMGSEAEGV